MRLCRSTFLLVTCVTYLAPVPLRAETTGTHFVTPALAASAASSAVAQTSSAITGSQQQQQTPLSSGSQGPTVTTLQTQLKQLGYYKGTIDGKYGESTQTAVSQFQKAKGLEADGIAGTTTLSRIQADLALKTTPAASKPTVKRTAAAPGFRQGWLWWLLVILAALGVTGGMLYLLKRFGKARDREEPPNHSDESLNALQKGGVITTLQEFDGTNGSHISESGKNSNNGSALNHSEIVGSTSMKSAPAEEATAQAATDGLPIEPTTRLAKINIVEELIKELRSSDPAKRRKAIWDLGQQGDSRAIQPLVELMIDSDSKQSSLILAALAEIGNRTLKPMSRALAISLQDENAEVRKNAIRDLTRIYDQMAQISQLLCHAVEDPDAEVQETARYALSQLNRIRAVPIREGEEEQGGQGDRGMGGQRDKGTRG